MPNHVTNNLFFRYDYRNEEERKKAKEDFEKLKEMMKTKESEFDFNAIIPMPETVYQGKIVTNWKPLGKNTDTWHDWSEKNWGTKWNAYRVEIEENSITFQTAWDYPEPVIKAISRKFPDSDLVLVYQDEITEHEEESLTFRNGEIIDECEPQVASRVPAS